MQTPLTDKQRKVVEENYNLIEEFLATQDLDANQTLDWYGCAATGLCQAVKIIEGFSPGGEMSLRDIAYVCMSAEICGDLWNELNPIHSTSYEENAEFIERVNIALSTECVDNIIDKVCMYDAMEKVLKTKSLLDRSIIESLFKKWLSFKEVSLQFNVHVSYVREVYNKFLKEVRHLALT